MMRLLYAFKRITKFAACLFTLILQQYYHCDYKGWTEYQITRLSGPAGHWIGHPALAGYYDRYLVEHQARLGTKFYIRLKTEYMTQYLAKPVTEINIVPDTWYKNGRISCPSLAIINEFHFFETFKTMYVCLCIAGWWLCLNVWNICWDMITLITPALYIGDGPDIRLFNISGIKPDIKFSIRSGINIRYQAKHIPNIFLYIRYPTEYLVKSLISDQILKSVSGLALGPYIRPF